MKSDPHALIFTEDFDYSKTSKHSIWGSGDTETLVELQKLISTGKISGTWLNIAAGDGRYNELLLKAADTVVATDVDPDALKKLRHSTPQALTTSLQTQVQDITKSFPFEDASFNGVFNTGTLHLFPKETLGDIFHEVARVLKPNGLFIFDFATDIQRIREGGIEVGRSHTQYSKDMARELIPTLLAANGCSGHFIFGVVAPEQVTTADGTYRFSCNFWLVVAEKK